MAGGCGGAGELGLEFGLVEGGIPGEDGGGFDEGLDFGDALGEAGAGSEVGGGDAVNLLGVGVHFAVGVEALVVEGLAGGGAYDGKLDNLGVVVQAGGFGVENHRAGLRGK